MEEGKGKGRKHGHGKLSSTGTGWASAIVLPVLGVRASSWAATTGCMQMGAQPVPCHLLHSDGWQVCCSGLKWNNYWR